MHAVFVVSEIDAKRVKEAEAMLKEGLVPQVKGSPGFVSGTWGRSADGTEARSMVIFDSEDAARATVERVTAGMPADGPVKIVSASVLEVVVQA